VTFLYVPYSLGSGRLNPYTTGGRQRHAEVDGGRHPGRVRHVDHHIARLRRGHRKIPRVNPFFLFITLKPRVSDAQVCEPQMRALLGTASHFCEVVVNPTPNQIHFEILCCAILSVAFDIWESTKLHHSANPTAKIGAAEREGNNLKGFQFLPESHGQNLAVTVLYAKFTRPRSTLVFRASLKARKTSLCTGTPTPETRKDKSGIFTPNPKPPTLNTKH